MIDHRCAREDRCTHAVVVEVEDQCPCECHYGPHYPCSVPGGCGYLHAAGLRTVGAPIEQPYGLCYVCGLVVGDALIELPHDYVALRMAQFRGIAPATGELVMSTKDLPIPISLTFATLAEQIEVEVSTFAEPVAERLNIDWDNAVTPRRASRYGPPPRYLGPVVLSRSASLLASCLNTLLDLPAWEYRVWGDNEWIEIQATGIEVALILLSLHQAARATLGLTRAMVTMPAPCPWCKGRIVQIAGREFKQCESCQYRFTALEYEQLTIITINNQPEDLRTLKQANKHARAQRKQVLSTADGTVGRPIVL